MKFSKSVFSVLLIALASVFLTGCGSWKWFDDNKPALEFAVKVAVVDLIDRDKVDGDRVIEVAEVGAKFLDANPQAQAGEIIAAVNKEIRWEKLSAGQALLAESLLTVLQEKIAADIEKGVVNADAKASVREIIDWVKEAAMMAKARQASVDDGRTGVGVIGGGSSGYPYLSDIGGGSRGALAMEKVTDNISTETIIMAALAKPALADRRPGI